MIRPLSCHPVDKPIRMRRTILLLAALFCLSLSPSAQQKRVLLEKYTSAFCGACPNAHLIAEELAASYPELTLAFHHSSVDGMANPYSTEWRSGFGLLGTPMGIVGRSGPAANQIAAQPQQWEARILEQLNEPAYVGLELQGSYNPFSRALALDISCAFTERPPAGELRLNLMVTEDSVIHAGYGFDQSNYFNEVEGHPLFGLGQPIYFYPHHHVVREIADGAWGTPDVFPELPEIGQVYSHHYDYFVPWNWDQKKIKVIVFVSLYSENNPMQRKVLNVIEQPLPGLLTTAAESPASDSQTLRVFPNPATEQLHLTVPEYTRLVELHTPSGRVVYSHALSPGIQQIDVSGLAGGLYLVRAETRTGVQVQKVIIQGR